MYQIDAGIQVISKQQLVICNLNNLIVQYFPANTMFGLAASCPFIFYLRGLVAGALRCRFYVDNLWPASMHGALLK